MPTITTCSVKVMRSFDCCHFEIVLGGQSDADGPITPKDVDDLRKKAARLADKAVEQYKVTKLNLERAQSDVYAKARFQSELRQAEDTPEGERTPRDMAIIKYGKDTEWRQSRRHYDYEDEWTEDEVWEPDFENDDEVKF